MNNKIKSISRLEYIGKDETGTLNEGSIYEVEVSLFSNDTVSIRILSSYEGTPDDIPEDFSLGYETPKIFFKSWKVPKAPEVNIVDYSALPADYYMRDKVLAAVKAEVENDVIKKGLAVPPGALLEQS